MFSLIVFCLIVAVLFWLLVTEWYNASLRQFVITHFVAIIGIPAAAVFAFLIVALFETKDGQVKFTIATVTFDGAGGPIVMWLLCFLSITISLRLLWAL
jgi:hypothetical protein